MFSQIYKAGCLRPVWLFVVILFFGSAEANAASIVTEKFRSGPWQGKVFYDASGNGFQSCSIWKPNRNNDWLGFFLTEDSRFSVSVYNSKWQLSSDFRFDATALLDGRFRYQLNGSADSHDQVSFEMKHTFQEVELFRSGGVFEIQTPFGPKVFSLSGSRAALDQLIACRNLHGQKLYLFDNVVNTRPNIARHNDTPGGSNDAPSDLKNANENFWYGSIIDTAKNLVASQSTRLLDVIGPNSSWAIGNTKNCQRPSKAYTLAINPPYVIWRDGLGNVNVESIVSSGENEFVTTTDKSIHVTKKNVTMGQTWSYRKISPSRIHVSPSGKASFYIEQCS